LFGGAVGKDTVSRAWRKVQGDWEAWQKRDLSHDDIVRVILDGTVVKVRLDKRSTGISVLVALGVRRDGQKVLLGLVGLWQDKGRESAEVKRIALEHVAELEAKIAEMQAMSDTRQELADACHGDHRPDCPILRDLENFGSRNAFGHGHTPYGKPVA
jgi:transposase-like protein